MKKVVVTTSILLLLLLMWIIFTSLKISISLNYIKLDSNIYYKYVLNKFAAFTLYNQERKFAKNSATRITSTLVNTESRWLWSNHH